VQLFSGHARFRFEDCHRLMLRINMAIGQH